jgi:hypothetical protein
MIDLITMKPESWLIPMPARYARNRVSTGVSQAGFRGGLCENRQ